MTDVALIREDTGDTLVLEGTTRVRVTHNGKVTDYPVPDRQTVSDGVIQMPRTATIEAVVSPHPARPDIIGGPERLEAVEQWLAEVKESGTTVALQRPGKAQLPIMAVERFSTDDGNTSAMAISVSLKGVRLQSSRAVSLGVLPTTTPRPDTREALEDAEDTGTGTTSVVDVSVLKGQILDPLADQFGGLAGGLL